MKRISTMAISTLAALSFMAAATVTPAQAGDRTARIAAGVFLGIVGTAIVANELKKDRKKRKYAHRHYPSRVYHDDVYVKPRHHRVDRGHRQSSWERHVRRCYRAYRSYDEFSDTWIDRRGRERLCRL